MSDLSCTFPDFKRMCKELLDAAPSLNDDELNNAVKCLNIGYLNLNGTEQDQHQANLALQITLRAIHAVDRLISQHNTMQPTTLDATDTSAQPDPHWYKTLLTCADLVWTNDDSRSLSKFISVPSLLESVLDLGCTQADSPDAIVRVLSLLQQPQWHVLTYASRNKLFGAIMGIAMTPFPILADPVTIALADMTNWLSNWRDHDLNQRGTAIWAMRALSEAALKSTRLPPYHSMVKILTAIDIWLQKVHAGMAAGRNMRKDSEFEEGARKMLRFIARTGTDPAWPVLGQLRDWLASAQTNAPAKTAQSFASMTALVEGSLERTSLAQVHPVYKALNEVHSWLVCHGITTPVDMAQSFAHMYHVVCAPLSVSIDDAGEPLETPAA